MPFSLMAQNQAQPKYKPEMLQKNWKIVAYESFGSKQEPDEKEKDDHMQFNKNGEGVFVEHGVSSNLKYQTDKMMSSFTLMPTKGARRVYKIISLTDTEMVLSYQDSVLVKWKYYLQAK